MEPPSWSQATNHEHTLGRPPDGHQGQVRKHLLIRALVTFCELNDTIEYQHSPVRCAVKDEDVLHKAARCGLLYAATLHGGTAQGGYLVLALSVLKDFLHL